MLEGILEKILAKILGEYIENLDTSNLHVGVTLKRYGLEILNSKILKLKKNYYQN